MEKLEKVLNLLFQIKVSGDDVFRLADSITLLNQLKSESKVKEELIEK